MGLGISLFLIAIGAILRFAVHLSVRGVDVDAVGVVLMVVGAIGLLTSMLFWSTWGGAARRRDTVVVGRGARRRVIEDDRVL